MSRELWYPGAEIRLGPENKTYGTKDVFGITGHSSEGNFAGDMVMLDRQERPRVSWTIYNPRSGPMLQHYPFNAITWHTGSRRSWGTIGVETEGFAGEPLTASQNGNMIEFLGWCRQNFGWAVLGLNVHIFEHNFWVATACPSHRYLWDVLLPAANEIGGDLMTSAEYEELKQQITNLRKWSMEADKILVQKIDDNVIDLQQFVIARTEMANTYSINLHDRLNGLVCTTRAIERAIAAHFQTHNTGGSIVEKAGVSILEEVTKLVEKAEESRDALLEDLNELRAALAEGGTIVEYFK